MSKIRNSYGGVLLVVLCIAGWGVIFEVGSSIDHSSEGNLALYIISHPQVNVFLLCVFASGLGILRKRHRETGRPHGKATRVNVDTTSALLSACGAWIVTQLLPWMLRTMLMSSIQGTADGNLSAYQAVNAAFSSMTFGFFALFGSVVAYVLGNDENLFDRWARSIIERMLLGSRAASEPMPQAG